MIQYVGGQFAGYITQVETGDAKDNGSVLVKFELAQTTSLALYDWIKSSFDRNHRRSDGAIHASDGDGTIISTIDFFDGLITELGFPPDDTSGKDPHKLSIGFVADKLRHKKGSGKVADLPPSPPQKTFTPSAFQLSVDGVDQPVAGSFSGLKIRQNETTSRLRMSFIPNDDFLRWYSELFIQGGRHRTGSIQYVTPNLNEPLLSIDFMNMGIFKHTSNRAQPNPEQIFELTATPNSVDFTPPNCERCQ